MPRGVIGGSFGIVGSTMLSPYESVVMADTPLGFWMMNETSGTNMYDSSGNGLHGNYTSALLAQPGPPGIASSANYNGVNAHAATATLPIAALGSGAELTIEFALFANWSGTSVLAEMDNYDSTSGKATIAHDSSQIHVGERYGSYRSRNYPRPAAASWHFYSIVWSMANGGASMLSARIDGVEQPGTTLVDSISTGTFSDSILWLMAREGSQYYQSGRMCGLAVYPARLNNSRRDEHYRVALGVT